MNKDKYKYLEKINNKEVIDFYKSENKKTLLYLKDNNYKSVREEISRALLISWRTTPNIKENYKFWIEYSYKDKYSKLYSQYKDNKPKMIIDFNKLKNEIIYEYNSSKSGEFVVYLTEKQGLETYYYHLINSDGKKIKDNVDNICTFLCWDKDIGFYYIKKIYLNGDIRDYSSYSYEIFYHKIGENCKKDKKFLPSTEKEFDNKAFIDMSLSDDSKYSILISNSYDDQINFFIIKDNIKNEIIKKYIYKDYSLDGRIYNDNVYIYTNKDSEYAQIQKISIKDIKKGLEPEIFIKEEKFLLDTYCFSKDYIYCVYLKDVAHFIRIYDYKGNFVRDINFDIKGTVYLSSDTNSNDIYIFFESFTYPHTIYKYLFEKDKLETIYQSKVKKEFNPENYKLEYKLIKSKDGTKVPAFIIYNKNNNLDTSSPTLLYGYGGFGFSTYPHYNPQMLPFLNNGGIYVIANIRGGKEFGKNWYYQAKGAKNKIKSIEDFISISEYLIDKGYTDNSKLFINGVSNGGFIVSAAMVMRPDLYKGVISEVPLVDFLIYKKYGIGSLLVDEYGDPDNKEDLKYILKWSPYQNIKKGIKYPDILITGAVNDTRVGLAQPLKFTKKMQDYSKGKTHLYVEEEAGHFGYADIENKTEKNALIFNFIYKNI